MITLFSFTLLHSERSKLYGFLAILTAIGLMADPIINIEKREKNEKGTIAPQEVYPYSLNGQHACIGPYIVVSDTLYSILFT